MLKFCMEYLIIGEQYIRSVPVRTMMIIIITPSRVAAAGWRGAATYSCLYANMCALQLLHPCTQKECHNSMASTLQWVYRLCNKHNGLIITCLLYIRVCTNNWRIYECNLSHMSFWAQLSVWWARQFYDHLLHKDAHLLSMQTQHSCSSLEGYSLLRCYNLVILTLMHMHLLHSSALLLSSS